MKRVQRDDGEDSRPILHGGEDTGKRTRSGSPSKRVGPLLFSGSSLRLEKALFPVQPSSMPGVCRLSPQTSTLVRLYVPILPPPQFLEVDISDVLQAIDGKCVFVFGASPAGVNLLLEYPVICRFGIAITVNPPESLIQTSIPVVEDPSQTLATLCNYHDYLGPSAVLVINSEVKATCMLNRSPESLKQTLNEWYYA